MFILGFNKYWIKGCGCLWHVACRSLSQGSYDLVTSKYLCHKIVTTLSLLGIFVERLLQGYCNLVNTMLLVDNFVTSLLQIITTLYDLVFVGA